MKIWKIKTDYFLIEILMIQFSKILIFIKGKLINKIKMYNLKLQILAKLQVTF